MKARSISITVLLFFLPYARSAGQSQEIRLNMIQTPVGSSVPVRIVTNTDGSMLVGWDGGGQLLSPEGQEVGDDIPDGGLFGCIVPMGISRWALLRKADTVIQDSLDGLLFREIAKYYFVIRDDRAVVDSSDTLFAEFSQSHSGDGFSKGGTFKRIELVERDGRICLATSYSGGTSSYPSGMRTSFAVQELVFGAANTPFVRSKLGSSLVGNSHDFVDYCTAAWSESGKLYTLHRKELLPMKNQHTLTLSERDPSTGDARTAVVLDAPAFPPSNYSDRLIVYDDGRADILMLKATGDTLIVRRYNSQGGLIEEKVLLTDVLVYNEPDQNRCFDADVVRLRPRVHAVTWSESSYQVFLAGFDSTWNMIGKRIGIPRTSGGAQYHPGITVYDDTMGVAWIGTRNGRRDVYFLRYPASEVAGAYLSVNRPVVDAFTVQGPFPNPCSVFCTLEMELSQLDECTIEVIDLLGRIVHTQTIMPVQLRFNARLHTGILRPGLYFLHVRTGSSAVTRKLAVRR